jgi:hypothetical protein
MGNTSIHLLLLVALLAAAVGLPACSQEPAPAPGGPNTGNPEAPAEKIGEDRYRVGKVTVDLKAKTATCSGVVNMQKGIIEYLAIAPRGKGHESLLALDVRPLHLQVGLILLGLEPKGGIFVQGDNRIPKGSPVDLWVSWSRQGKSVKVPAEEMVWNIDRKRPMDRGPWVFSGSLVDEEGFLGDRELSLIATYRDPAAIINNALPTGSDDSIYKVNERIVPPVKTPVTLTITPRGG